MTVNFNCTGDERKRLVKAISEITGQTSRYLGAPSFAYEIGRCTVDKNGVLNFEETPESKTLLDELEKRGFQDADSNKFTVEMPEEMFTEQIFRNLDQILKNRHDMICHALNTDKLDYEIADGRVKFPWFTLEKPDDGVAYMSFMSKLHKMAFEQTRINNKPCETSNEKYTMRCFLIRMGMVGSEYKQIRKVLLRNLEGSSAFRDGRPAQAANAEGGVQE